MRTLFSMKYAEKILLTINGIFLSIKTICNMRLKFFFIQEIKATRKKKTSFS